MTSATTALSSTRSRGGGMLTLLMLWHVAFAVILLAGALTLFGSNPARDLVSLVVTVAMALLGIGSAAAALFIFRRDHLGRTLSLVVNYICFIACLALLAQALGLFIGLDDLAKYAARGIPFLLALIFLIGAFVSSVELRNKPVSPARKTLGRIIMIVGGVGFVLSAGLVPALVSLPGKYAAGGPMPLIFTVGVVVLAFMLWAMWRSASATAMGAKNFNAERLNGWLFLSPNLIGFMIFFAGPLLISLYVSFTNWDTFNQRDWVGLANYQKVFNVTVQPLATPDQAANQVLDVTIYDELGRINLFGNGFVVGAEDKLFWISLRNTLLFGLIGVPLSVIPALFLATLLNSKLPGMRVYRTLYFIPSVAAVVGVALIWQWMFNSQVGWINYFISSAVNFFNGVFNANIQDPKIGWLSDSNYALLAVVIMAAWQWVGFNTVLFVTGMQTIPRELYEAATVDGANPVEQFFNVTLPMLAPTTLYVLITTTILAMQVFDQVFIVSNGAGGPSFATLTMTLNLYQNGFQSFRQGYASALAWVLFIAIFAFTLFQFLRQRRESGAYDM